MQVAKELNAALDDMEQSLVKKVADAPVFRKLPENGVSADELITELDKYDQLLSLKLFASPGESWFATG